MAWYGTARHGMGWDEWQDQTIITDVYLVLFFSVTFGWLCLLFSFLLPYHPSSASTTYGGLSTMFTRSDLKFFDLSTIRSRVCVYVSTSQI